MASSLIRSRSHGGDHTSLTRTSLTPGTAAIADSTSPGMLCATGQAGVVRVISTKTMPPFRFLGLRYRRDGAFIGVHQREAMALLAHLVALRLEEPYTVAQL